LQRGLYLGQARNVVGALRVELGGFDHRDRQRHGLDVFLAAARRDDDGVAARAFTIGCGNAFGLSRRGGWRFLREYGSGEQRKGAAPASRRARDILGSLLQDHDASSRPVGGVIRLLA
jgi:hypothetical protein